MEELNEIDSSDGTAIEGHNLNKGLIMQNHSTLCPDLAVYEIHPTDLILFALYAKQKDQQVLTDVTVLEGHFQTL